MISPEIDRLRNSGTTIGESLVKKGIMGDSTESNFTKNKVTFLI